MRSVNFHAAALAAAFLFLVPARAQTAFGMNKVQYGHHTWYYVDTKHFTVYFPDNAAVVGEYVATHAEPTYDTVSRILGFPLRGRVPIVLYSTPAEFQQTNIVPYLLPEGVGGFTEIFRNRVVIPFEGGYGDLRHVLQHEMTHAFMFDRQNVLGSKFALAQGPIPLWFNEGLAEYSSLGWDLGSEFYLMDAVLFGYLANPGTEDMQGFLAYKGGQMFYYYLSQTFGPAFIRDWIGEVNQGHDFEKTFKKLAHASLREVGEIWLRELRAIYWPELRTRHYGKSLARQLTDHTVDASNINMQPALSPDGKKLAFFSDKQPMVGLYVMDLEKEKVSRSLSFAGSTRGHLSFYPFQSRITWSPDGKNIAFVSKTGDHDVISIVDAKNGRSRGEISPPGMQGILSPAWSPKSNVIVFNGLKNGFSDLFIWDLDKKELRRLTHDIAVDQNPAFSPSGKWIAFESDRARPDLPQAPKDPFAGLSGNRPSPYLAANHDIYVIADTGGTPVRALGGPFDETMPAFGPSDSQLVFVSNRSGVSNMYLAVDSGGGWRAKSFSNLASTVFNPTWARSGNKLAFSLFENQGFDLFIMGDPRLSNTYDTLPRTQFVRKIENPSLHFFSPIPLKNLTTYVRDSAKAASARSTDSLIRQGAKPAAVDSSREAASRDSAAGAATQAASAGKAPPKDSLTLAQALPPTDTLPAGDTARGGAAPGAGSANGDTSLVAGETASRGERLTMNGFEVEPYRPKWGLEVAAADLGYDTFSRGIIGQSYITVSDLLGNHKISFTLSSGGLSLKATNFAVLYDLLPYRTDYGFSVFHFGNYFLVGGNFYYLDQEWGGGVTARYPLSIFTRFELNLQGFAISRGLYDAETGSQVSDSLFPTEALNVFRPSVGWVNDNSNYGPVGPLLGRRMAASLAYVPPLSGDSISFVQADADVRRYWLFFKKYSVAARVSAGMSQAVGDHVNPAVYLGGGDDLIPFVARIKSENDPVGLAQSAFAQIAVPVRGFRYYEFRGDRKFITNLEFRFPFVDVLHTVWPLPITIRYLMGTLFVDYGGAWSGEAPGNELRNALDTLGLGYGYGFRLNLGVFVLRYTRAHTWDGIGPGTGEFRSYWSLGGEF
jgi:Tol biopolymer transport system component